MYFTRVRLLIWVKGLGDAGAVSLKEIHNSSQRHVSVVNVIDDRADGLSC
jgi:hypothetical protein